MTLRDVLNTLLVSPEAEGQDLPSVIKDKVLERDEDKESQKALYQRTLILCFDGTSNEYNSKNTV